MEIVTLTKKNKILKGEISLPASKSISNRALIIKHLSHNQQQLNNLSKSDDTQLMIQLLDIISNKQSLVQPTELNCQNAGTVIRFLTAILAITTKNWILTGTDRMKERPIGILVETLSQLGAEINYLEKKGFPPLEIKGKVLKGGPIKIDGSVSSQFISALLLIAPKIENGLRLTLTNKISSRPYVEMTLNLLKHFGINYTFEGNEIFIQQQDYKAGEIKIETDWSAAAYWYEMVAFTKEVDVILKGLHKESLQGDSVLAEIYKNFGVKTEFLSEGIKLTKSTRLVKQFDFDFTNYPDLAQPVIVTCAALGINGTFTGLESLRIKETDRLNALQAELKKLGFKTELVRGSEFRVRSFMPGKIKNQKSKIVNTFDDHRMAMAFAPLAMIFDILQIENPQVVSKSYPEFWESLQKFGFLIK